MVLIRLFLPYSDGSFGPEAKDLTKFADENRSAWVLFTLWLPGVCNKVP